MKPKQKKEKKPRNFGLNFGDDALDLWASWHFDKLMPLAGGLFDQPEAWFADMQALDYEYAIITERLKKGFPAQDKKETEQNKPKRIDELFTD